MKRTPRPLKNLPFLEHLEELRGRIIQSVIAVVVASCFFYQYVDDIIPQLVRPVGRLVFTAPAEALAASLTLTFLGGFFIASPFVIFHIWQFVGHALTEGERRYIAFYGPCSLALFLLGGAFGYIFILPVTFKFFLGFSSRNLVPMITIKQYISFVGSLCVSFGIIFELPLVLMFLTRIGIVTPAFLSQKRRHAIVLIFIISAILTPSPDYVSQILMAIPMLGLYELGFVFSRLTYRPAG